MASLPQKNAAPSSRSGAAAPPAGARSVVDALRQRLVADGSRVAYRYLSYQPEEIVETITYDQLDHRAQVTAARLQAAGASGQRVLLIAEPGIDFVTSLYGCLYAGAVAVPAYPPDAFSLSQTIPRLLTMVGDAQAKYMIASHANEHPLREHFGGFAFDAAEIGRGDLPRAGVDWSPHAEAKLALLQYTSGSTGTPRGVMVSHTALLANVNAIREFLDVEQAKMLHWLPPYHDLGLIGGVFSPVVAGRESIFMSPFSFMQRPLRWLRAIHEYRATTTASPNFGFEVCLRKVKPEDCRGLDLSCLKVVVSGAERIRMGTMQAFFERFEPLGFNPSAFRAGYGLAESTLMVTATPRDTAVRSAAATPYGTSAAGVNGASQDKVGAALEIGSNTDVVSCGTPFEGNEVLVVDPTRGLPVPDGAVGEVWVDSPSNGAGYWGNQEATHATFKASLADDPRGPRFLRTGDLGFTRDGELFITGRLKELVIVAGRKYFPQDLELAAASSHDALKVDASAAFAVEADDHEQLVMVHEVARPKRHDLDEIVRCVRQAIQQQHAISPQNVVLVENGALPKTTSGKLQRTACRRMFVEGRLAPLKQWAALDSNLGARTGTPPDTQTQRRVAAVWVEVLDLDVVYQEDDFFALGGHSLTAMQMAVRLEEQFEVKLPLRDVFMAPSMQQLAATVDTKLSAQGTGTGQQSMPHHADAAAAPSALPTAEIPTLPARDGTQLSFSEQRMWFSEQLEPANPFYNLPLAARVSGKLDPAAVSRALQAVIERHESLRTTYFLQDGQPRRRVHAAKDLKVEVEQVDLRNEPSTTLWQQVYQQARAPFSLNEGPLLRQTLFRIADDEHVVLLVLHHIIADGWSMGVMLTEFAELYRAHQRGETPRLEPLQLQYGDYAAWQRARLSEERIAELFEYWTRVLDGAPGVINLPLDRPRPAVQDFEGRQLTLALSPQVSAEIRRHCVAQRVTPFTFLLSAYVCLLSRVSAQADIVVGTAAASRVSRAMEDLIGFFVNTLVVRTRLDDDPTFAELLPRVAEAALEAQTHGELPFEKLVERCAASRDRSHSPIFQAAFVYQRPLGDLPAPPGLSMEPLRVDNGTAKHDLTFEFDDVGDRFVLTAHFRIALFDRASIERLANSFEVLCAAALQQPDTPVSRLQVLNPDQSQRVVKGFNDTACDYGGPYTLHELFGRHAESDPDAPAILTDHVQQTYGELALDASRVARGLAVAGAAAGAYVLTLLPRSPELEALMLGIFESGAAYVPLDVNQPGERSLDIVQQCLRHAPGKVLLVASDQHTPLDWLAESNLDVTTTTPQALRDAGSDSSAPLPKVTGEDIAYVIFTSGSTGTPKGVRVTHDAIANFVRAQAQRLGVRREDRVLHALSPAFDGGLSEAVLALATGAASVVAPEDCRDPKLLAALLRRRHVTVAKFTPALLEFLDATNLPDLRVISTGGDTLSGELAERWLAAGKRFFNGYGPTEAAVGVTMHEVTSPAPDRPPIGLPMANMQVYVLDAHLQPQPIGVVGEIYIGGAGLAVGYLGDPELTQQRFVPSPFDGASNARLYATGDLGRWNSAGVLEFVGRKDRQVKVQGYRVEPDEIARHLEQLESVQDAAVTTGPQGELIAYVVHAQNRLQSQADKHVRDWEALFEQSRRAAPVALDPQFDTTGWISSYTGKPLSPDVMREWLDCAAANVQETNPERVLEIGCGTGMILFRVAPLAQHYTGTDLLASSLKQVREAVARREELRDRVRLLHAAADDLQAIAGERFDTVVLNSVVQYFPDANYLLKVLDQAVQHVAPGGSIVVGDVRSLAHQKAFACGIERLAAPAETSCDQLLRRAAARVAREEELLIDPSLFHALRSRYPNLADVTVRLKRGADHNELTRYRYEVLLRFADDQAATDAAPPALPSVQCGGLRELDEQFRKLSKATCFTGLLNSRVAGEVHAMDFASSNPQAPVSGIPATPPEHSGVDPHDVEVLAEKVGVRVRITWDEDQLDQMKVIAWPADGAPPAGASAASTDLDPPRWSQWCNNPLASQQSVETTRQLRTDLRQRVPDYMVPTSFMVVDAIPRTASGKVNFDALPAPSATTHRSAESLEPAQTATEEKLVEIWESLLGVTPIGVTDDFFELGGHSMLAVRLMAAIEDQLEREVPLAALFRDATIRSLASLVDDPNAGQSAGSLVTLQQAGSAAPLFCLHPAGGTVFCYKDLATQFAGDRPVHALQAVGIDGGEQPQTEVPEMAAHYAETIIAAFPDGPYHLTGWSLGGTLAFEVARQLQQLGKKIGALVLIDAAALGDASEFQEEDFENMMAAMFPSSQRVALADLRAMDLDEQLKYFVGLAAQAGLAPAGDVEAAQHVYDVFRANVKALHEFRPQPYDGPVVLIRPKDQGSAHPIADDPTQGWAGLSRSVDVQWCSGDHAGMVYPPHVEGVAKLLQTAIAGAEAT